MLKIEIEFDGNDSNGMPPEDIYDAMNSMEEELMIELKDVEGYLNIGRQTGDNKREIYFACKDFRKPSKVMDQLLNK